MSLEGSYLSLVCFNVTFHVDMFTSILSPVDMLLLPHYLSAFILLYNSTFSFLFFFLFKDAPYLLASFISSLNPTSSPWGFFVICSHLFFF